jgi:hypothetical protein
MYRQLDEVDQNRVIHLGVNGRDRSAVSVVQVSGNVVGANPTKQALKILVSRYHTAPVVVAEMMGERFTEAIPLARRDKLDWPPLPVFKNRLQRVSDLRGFFQNEARSRSSAPSLLPLRQAEVDGPRRESASNNASQSEHARCDRSIHGLEATRAARRHRRVGHLADRVVVRNCVR